MKTRLIVAVIVLMVAGCGKVWMAPDYQAMFEADARRVTELDRRCQAGDDLACKEGLSAAAECLNLWVDAVHGVDGGDAE
jgi:hypothetical protein